MKKYCVLILSCILSSFQTHNPAHGKLIVLIAVDGLRGDLLEKYRTAFTHGFKRMFDTGMDFTNAWDDHAITVSHAGHVTLATGNYPRTSGIVDAGYYVKSGDSLAYTDAFPADSAYAIAGEPGTKSISTKSVLTPGLAEWVNDNNARAKIICVGTGEISSALYCFHPGEDVYWYNLDLGRYVTSTYYKKDAPAWINDFNKNALPEYLKKARRWENIVPEKFMHLANKDDEPFERGGRKHVFPYTIPDSISDETIARNYIRFFPFCDFATLALAKSGIEARQMGQGSTTDYLSIVLSQVDDANHDFGPSSLETFNVLMQIDIALGDFIDFLDRKVGKNNYVVALSADHGFPEVPEQTLQQGQPAKRVSENEVTGVLTAVQDMVDHTVQTTQAELQEKIKTYLLTVPFVADAYTTKQLNDAAISSDKFLELFKKSYRADRIPRLPFFSLTNFRSVIAKQGLMLRLKENTFIDLDTDIHGSAYDYDRYVPMIFMGAGVRPGRSAKKVYTVDVAPSLAKLAGVKIGNATDGSSLF